MGFTGSYVIFYGSKLPPKVSTYIYFSAHFLIFNHLSNFIVFIFMHKKIIYSVFILFVVLNSMLILHNCTGSFVVSDNALLNKRERSMDIQRRRTFNVAL